LVCHEYISILYINKLSILSNKAIQEQIKVFSYEGTNKSTITTLPTYIIYEDNHLIEETKIFKIDINVPIKVIYTLIYKITCKMNSRKKKQEVLLKKKAKTMESN